MIFWIFIILFFVLAFVGILFPVIPSFLSLWAGFLIYHFSINDSELGVLFWIFISILTVLLFVSDILVNSYFVKKYGGSKWSNRIGAFSIVFSSFIFPPFGIVIIPFAVVFIVETIQKKPAQEALYASVGTLVGFFGSSLAKFILQLLMVIAFLIDVFVFRV